MQDGASVQGMEHGHGAWQHRAWQSMGICQDTRAEHTHAKAGPLFGLQDTKEAHRQSTWRPVLAQAKDVFALLRNGQTYEILVSEPVTPDFDKSDANKIASGESRP